RGRAELTPATDSGSGDAGPDLPDRRPVRYHQVATLPLHRRTGIPDAGRAALPGVSAPAQAPGLSDGGHLRLGREAVAYLARPARIGHRRVARDPTRGHPRLAGTRVGGGAAALLRGSSE